jgi:hypothetical protein
MDEVDAFVEKVKSSTLAEKSRNIYINKCVQFIQWLDKNYPETLTEEFRVGKSRMSVLFLQSYLGDRTSIQDGERLKQCYIKDILRTPNGTSPIRFEQISVAIVQRFFGSLKMANGKRPGQGVYNTVRSAIKHLFRLYDQTLSAEMESAMKTFFKGLKRTTSQAASAGEARVEEGKYYYLVL